MWAIRILGGADVIYPRITLGTLLFSKEMTRLFAYILTVSNILERTYMSIDFLFTCFHIIIVLS